MYVLWARQVRYALWRLSQIAGWFRRRFLSGRRKLFSALAAAVASVVVERAVRGHRVGTMKELGQALGVWLLASFLLLLWQARRRVVIEQFTDWTGDAEKPDPRGIATLLVGEIAAYRELY